MLILLFKILNMVIQRYVLRVVGQRTNLIFKVTTVKKTITQREVHETIETLSGEKKFSTQESTTPKVRTQQ